MDIVKHFQFLKPLILSNNFKIHHIECLSTNIDKSKFTSIIFVM